MINSIYGHDYISKHFHLQICQPLIVERKRLEIKFTDFKIRNYFHFLEENFNAKQTKIPPKIVNFYP